LLRNDRLQMLTTLFREISPRNTRPASDDAHCAVNTSPCVRWGISYGGVWQSRLLARHPPATLPPSPWFFTLALAETHMLPDGPRRPLDATLTGPAERRHDRLVLAACTTCGHDTALRVMLRTPYVLYVRCERCVVMWTVSKPVHHVVPDRNASGL
jgi:hypothetical protein